MQRVLNSYNAATFDTHEIVKQFKAVGFTEEQAEAQVKVFQQIRDAPLDELASNGEMEEALADTKTDIIKWVSGMLIAQTGLIIAAIKLLQ